MVALSFAGRVGIDVERSTAGSFEGFDSVALHRSEQVSSVRDRSLLWVRKESVLKATGEGLNVDPRLLRVSGSGAPPRLLEWEGRALDEKLWMFDVTPLADYVGCVSVLGPERPDVIERQGALEVAA